MIHFPTLKAALEAIDPGDGPDALEIVERRTRAEEVCPDCLAAFGTILIAEGMAEGEVNLIITGIMAGVVAARSDS